MGDGISTSFVDFASFSLGFVRVRCILARLVLVRNWCGNCLLVAIAVTVRLYRQVDPRYYQSIFVTDLAVGALGFAQVCRTCRTLKAFGRSL
jgi:hypothetical protein